MDPQDLPPLPLVFPDLVIRLESLKWGREQGRGGYPPGIKDDHEETLSAKIRNFITYINRNLRNNVCGVCRY